MHAFLCLLLKTKVSSFTYTHTYITDPTVGKLPIRTPACSYKIYDIYVTIETKCIVVMLLTLKEDNMIGSFHLCCLLYVFSPIIRSGVICTSVHLYVIIIYVSTYTIGFCMCDRLLAICASTAVHAYIWILQSYR